MLDYSKNVYVSYFLGFIIVILSLENHGNSRFFFVLPMFILFFVYVNDVGIKKAIAKKFMIAISILFLLYMLSVIELIPNKENMGDYTNNEFYISLMLKFLLLFVFFCLMDVNHIYNSIGFAVKFHALIFFIQFLIVYGTGKYIDLLFPVTGEEARYSWGVSLPIIGNTYRPTGFFNEPSTYFSMIFPLVVLRYVFSEKLETIDYYALASFFLTLSFAAIAVTSLFFIVINLKELGKTKTLIAFILFAVLLPLAFLAYDARVSGDYDATGIRFNLFDTLINQSWSDIIFGNGPAGVPDSLSFLYESDTISWSKNGFAAINDLGVWFYVFLKFGLIGLFLFCIFLFIKTKNLTQFLAVACIFITKIKLTSMLFWFLIFVISIFFNRKTSEKS